MREKMDVKNFSPQQSAPEPSLKRFPEFSPATLMPLGNRGVGRFDPAPLLEVSPGESLPELSDRIRNEINRGREYLLQVQSELQENSRLLEQWAQYEQTCSLQPLDHLVQAVWLKQNVEKFLVGWLKRRQRELAKIERKIELSGAKERTLK